MPSLVSKKTAAPSFLLTFQGVDFRLDPKECGASISFDHADNGKVILKLANFSGCLQVTTSTTTTPDAVTPTKTPSGRVSLSPERAKPGPKKKTKAPRKKTVGKRKNSPPPKVVPQSETKPAQVFDMFDQNSKKRRVEQDDDSVEPSHGQDGSVTVSSSSSSSSVASSVASKKSRNNVVEENEAPSLTQGEVPSLTQRADPSMTQRADPSLTQQQTSPSFTQADENTPSAIDTNDSQFVDDFDDDDVSHDDHHFNGISDLTQHPSISPCSKTPQPFDQTAPPARWGHTMTRLQEVSDDGTNKNTATKFLVYGGQTVTDDYNVVTHGDIYVYDCEAREWSKPVHCEGVERQWHSATFVPERQLLIAFGGEAPDKTKKGTGKMTSMNQVMVLDTEIMLWYPPSVSGDVPNGRSGHTATMVSNNTQMVVFGGVGKAQKFQTATYVLDTARWKWTRPLNKQMQGDAPRPRSYHSATAVSKGVGKDWIVYFGGNDHDTCFNSVHVLEVKSNVGEDTIWSWINPIVCGDVPAPRTGHTATLLEDGHTILIQGGWDPNTEEEDETIFDDCFLLDTSTWTWTKSVEQTGIGEARVGHRAVQYKENVLMFGGRLAGGKFSNELLKL